MTEDELQKRVSDLQLCRDIVKKIMDFGVDQIQLINIVYLLTLELENVDAMRETATIAKKWIPTLSAKV